MNQIASNVPICPCAYNTYVWVSLLHLVHTSKLWPNIKVCSKSIEIYYTLYVYVLVLTTHNRKGWEGIPQH